MIKTLYGLLLVAGVWMASAAPVRAAPIVTRMADLGGPTPQDLANALAGSGVTVVAGSAIYSGAAVAAGSFSGGGTDTSATLGIASGILLSTGDAANAATSNLNSLCCSSDGNASPGNALLDPLTHGEGSVNASILSFRVLTNASSISLKYVFASEEYDEFVGPFFNGDVLGMFVNGVNYATVPETGTPITINTINCVAPSHCDRYRNNPPFIGGIGLQFDGMTVVLTLTAPVNPGQENLVQLGIADSFDMAYDSAVFVQAGSLAAVPELGPGLLLASGLCLLCAARSRSRWPGPKAR